MEVVASLSQGRTAAAQCGLFTHKSVPVIFQPPCIYEIYDCPFVQKHNISRKRTFFSDNIHVIGNNRLWAGI